MKKSFTFYLPNFMDIGAGKIKLRSTEGDTFVTWDTVQCLPFLPRDAMQSAALLRQVVSLSVRDVEVS